MFLEDELPPNAVLIEYIPNLQHIDLSNYSKDRLNTFRDILYEINQARVYYADAYPRNMMISVGDSGEKDRVLWVDFDSAQTLPEDALTERQKTWIKREVNLMEYFVDAMANDYEEGRLNLAYSYYYEGFFDGVPPMEEQK